MNIAFVDVNNYQLKARIHISQFINSMSIQNQHPFQNYNEDDIINVKYICYSILLLLFINYYRVLDVKKVGENTFVECKIHNEMSMEDENENENGTENGEILTWENMQEDEVYKGIIVDIKTHEIMICLSPTIYGIVIPQECSDNININMDLLHNFSYIYIIIFILYYYILDRIGQIMLCRVLSCEKIKRKLYLSFLERPKNETIEIGDIIYGNIIDKNDLSHSPKVNVLIGHGIYGVLPCINVTDPEHFTSFPFKNYHNNAYIKARIIGKDENSDNKYILSSRPSILNNKSDDIEDIIENIRSEGKSLNVNGLVHGFIEATTKKGTFVQYIIFFYCFIDLFIDL